MGNNTDLTAAERDGVGSIEDLIVVVTHELRAPPHKCDRAMALVMGLGGADHLGLLSGGGLVSGGLNLLASAITARARPGAALLLEWLCERGGARFYRGWALERGPTQVSWRWLSAAELRVLVDPRTRRTLGEEIGALFEE